VAVLDANSRVDQLMGQDAGNAHAVGDDGRHHDFVVAVCRSRIRPALADPLVFGSDAAHRREAASQPDLCRDRVPSAFKRLGEFRGYRMKPGFAVNMSVRGHGATPRATRRT
jgi:hypothetical protein